MKNKWIRKGNCLAALIGGLLLVGSLGTLPARAQTAPDMGAIRKEFALKDATIAALRLQLAAKEAEIASLRRQLSSQSVPSVEATPQATPQANPTQPVLPLASAAFAPDALPVIRTRAAQGPSVVNGLVTRLYAADLAVTDSSVEFIDTPWEGKTLANAGNLHYLLFNGQRAGDSITFAFRVSRAGTYTVETAQYCTGDQGRYKVEIDGVALQSEMDFGNNNRQPLGKVSLSEGDHTLTYRADGTASDAAGYKVKGIGARFWAIDFVAAA